MIKTTAVGGNIAETEALMMRVRHEVDAVGPEIVAERLGITADDLEDRLTRFSDLTLTELRYLLSTINFSIHFYIHLNAGFPIVDENIAVLEDKKETKITME